MPTTQLASSSEFDEHVAPSTAFASIKTPTKDAALLWSSGVVLGFIKKRKVLPLLSWGPDLKHAACRIAAYDLMSKRGYDPSAGTDAVWRQRYDDAMAWLMLVSKGDAELVDCIDSAAAPTVDEAGPLATSDPIVNWNFNTRGAGRCAGGYGGGDGLG